MATRNTPVYLTFDEKLWPMSSEFTLDWNHGAKSKLFCSGKNNKLIASKEIPYLNLHYVMN